jgi:hypothetical protein
MENATENTTTATEVTEAQATETATEERTFTQAELNRIVQERVRSEQAKLEEYKAKATKFDELEEASKTELQKAQEKADKLAKELADLKRAEEIRTVRNEVATEKNIPVDLLTGETKEACEEQADAILKFSQSQGYPYVRDGGESNAVKLSAKEQFKVWAEQNL